MDQKYILLAATIFAVAASTPVKTYNTYFVVDESGIQSNNGMEVGIVGGNKIKIENANYIAAILNKGGKLIGTGAVLNNKWILTSAALFINKTEDDVQIRLGSSFSKKGGKIFKVAKLFSHEKYKYLYDYNIALVKLQTQLKFSSVIGRISITDSSLPEEGSNAVITGYGTTKRDDQGQLGQVSLPISHYSTCKPKMPFIFGNLSFCTAVDGKGPCLYDFGSPLVYKKKVIGLFSGTSKCASAKYPSGYADVYKYKNWIESKIKKNTEEGELIEHNENVYNIDE